jgi:hypothetical protein
MKKFLQVQTIPHILPKFTMADDMLYCDGRTLDLTRRPLTRKLIRAFLARPEQFISRKELVDIVYGNFDIANKSTRFSDALKQNITKMVSRVRALTEDAFNRPGIPWIEMFVYIPDEEGWCFYRLKNSYLKRREAELMQFFFLLAKLDADKPAPTDQAA